MNRPFVLAQATTPQGSSGTPPTAITIGKPQGEQAITIHLDGATKLDLSAIASEPITLVHLGDRLIILFDNHAQVTIEPFFGDNGQPLSDITVELGPGRDVSSTDFAGLFPITTDPSVLPASGGPGSVSSGADFVSFSIESLAGPGTGLPLLGASPPPLGAGFGTTTNEVTEETSPTSLSGASITAAVDEGGLITDTIGTTGNDHGFAFAATGVAGSLNALVNFGSAGPGATPFHFVSTASQWLAGLGLTSHGSPIDGATIVGNTLTATAQDGHGVFSLTLNTDGSWNFTLLAPIDAPPGGPIEHTATIDLSGFVQAVNGDGLVVTLSNDFKVLVTEDLPIALPGATAPTFALAEGGLQDAAHGGTDPFGEGNGGGLTAIEDPTGTLDALVAFGAAGPNATTPFRFAVANDSTINLGLTSHGAAVDFATVTTSAIGETLTAYTEGSTAGTKVFTLTIENDGAWGFQLFAPLDDGPNQSENGTTIDLSSLVQAVDFNGSAVTLAPHELQIAIADDSPLAATGVIVSGLVNDAGLDPGSTAPTSTGGVTGQLDALVHFGADGPSATPFQFLSDANFALTSALTSLGMTSAGAIVNTAIVTTTATGTTLLAEDPLGDQVFTLTLNNDGSWSFQLLGPIDVSGGLLQKFDLSSLVQAVDFDGNVTTLAANELEITVTADAPKATGASLAATVNEGGLFNITDTADNGTDPYGTGNESASATAFTGNIGDLDTLVTFGASGPAFVPFQFTVGNPADVVQGNPTSGAISLGGLMSHDMAVNFATVELVAGGEMLTAYTGSSASGTAVFTMTIDSNGQWSFTLLAPVDNTNNAPLAVDLSGLVQAVDTDGSAITLPPGDIVVTITDDAPLLVAGAPGFAGTVNEGGLASGNAPGAATSTPETPGQLDTLVTFGADGQNGTPFQFVVNASSTLANLNIHSQGVLVSDAEITTTPGSGTTLAAWTTGGPSGGGTEVFTLILNDDGSWTFDLLAPIDHNGAQTFDLSALAEAVDFDGSAVQLGANAIDVTITDDSPKVVTGATQTGAVDEGGLREAALGGTDPFGNGNDSPATIATFSGSVGGLDALVSFGADHANGTPFQFTVANNSTINLGTLKSEGISVDFATISGNTLTAHAGGSATGTAVFSLTLNDDGSWTFQLLAPIDHMGAPFTGSGPEPQTTIDLSGLVEAVDFDGSHVNLAANSLTVTVTDDVPVLTATQVTGSVDEGPLESGHPVPPLQTVNGTLTPLVDFGADGGNGPSGTTEFQLVGQAAADAWLTHLNLTLNGNPLHAVVSGSNLTVEDQSNATVFSLIVLGGGGFSFDLAQPIDQAINSTTTLDLSGFVQAVDGDGDSVTLSNDFLISVANDRPIAQDVVVTGNENTPPGTPNANPPPIAVTLSATEAPAGTGVLFTLLTLPTNGTLFLDQALTQAVATNTAYFNITPSSTLTLYFEPAPLFAGATSFEYTASDGNGATSPTTATATIDVVPIADPPVVTNVDANFAFAPVGEDVRELHTIALTGGGFVATWAAGPGGNEQVFAQVFDAHNQPIGGPITVGPVATTPDTQSNVVALPNGGFAMVWQDGTHLVTEAFDSHGIPAAGGIQTVSTTDLTVNTNAQIIVALANGDYAVVYGQHNGVTNTDDVFAHIYDATGHSVSGPIQANAFGVAADLFENTATPTTRDISQVVATEHGFVVMWESFSNDGSGGSTEHTYVRAINSDGTFASPAIEVNAPSAADVDTPGQVVALGGDDFAVMWQETTGGVTDTLTRIFKASDNYTGTTEIVTGAGGGGSEAQPWQMVELANGGYAAVWSQTGAGADVFAQVYDANGHLTGATPPAGIQVDTGGAAGFAFADDLIALKGGGFAVEYNNFSNEFVSTYDAQGHLASGGQVQLPSDPAATLASGNLTGMVALADGGFEAIWDQTVGTANGAQDQIWAQRFDASGKTVGAAEELFATPSNLSNLSEISIINEFKTAFADGTLLTGAVVNDFGNATPVLGFNGNSVTLDFTDTASGAENTPIALFNASIPPDPTETLTVTITGVPTGASFAINGVTVGAAGPAGTWIISDPVQTALLATSPLQLISPTTGTFTLHVDAQSTDTASTGTSMAHTTDDIAVTVFDTNDVTLSNPSAITVQSGVAAVSLGIGAPSDPDQAPGENDIITIQAAPTYGSDPNAGIVQYFDGTTWQTATDGAQLTLAELESLRFTPPASGSFTGDSLVYSVQDGASLVDGTVAITVTTPGGGLFFSADDPDLFVLDNQGHFTSIPVNPSNPIGSFAGEDGGFIAFANQLYFFANRDGVGNVLFGLGADDVAHPVLDTNGHTVGDVGGINADYTVYDGNLYFIGLGTNTGIDLMRIDADGVAHEIDINPGPAHAFDQFNSFGFAQFDGNLYFDAYSAASTNFDKTALFFVDPTGTPHQVLYNGQSLDDAGEDGGFFTFNGGLFFNAVDPTFGDSLFVLDANGQPTLVMSAGFPIPHVTGETTYFATLGANMYVTEETSSSIDGLFQVTPGGTFTEMLLNGTDSFDFTNASQSNLGGLVAFGGDLYFSADTPTSDAALGGNGFAPNPVLFQLDAHGNATPVTDASGNALIDAGENGGFASFNGHLYFFADDASLPSGTTGLFETDGSGIATPVLDPTSGHPFVPANANFTQFDGSLYFEAGTSEGFELVKIDSSGTPAVIDINPSLGPPVGSSFPGETGGFGVYNPIATVFGSNGNDHLSGGANTVFVGGTGNDTITGAGPGSHDTAVIDANFSDPSTHVSISGNTVTVVTANGTDTLTGIDRIQFADKGLLIVDQNGDFGFKSVQAAVNAATEGDTIWVMPGTYTETSGPNQFSSVSGGLFIDTPNLTLQGVTANGAPIAAASDVAGAMPTIISGAQNDFGSNIFVGPDADNTTIEGLHLQAGPATDNKLLEIWANNVNVENDFLDVDVGGTPAGYSGAIAIYFNDNGTTFTDEIDSYKVIGNILNEGIDVSNGVGVTDQSAPPFQGNTPSLDQIIAGNTFEGVFDPNTGLGRYDTLILNGNVTGPSSWLLESVQLPTVGANTIDGNATPVLLRFADQNPAVFPSAAEVQTIIAGLASAATTYAYILDPSGNPALFLRDFDFGNPVHSQGLTFYVVNDINTLDLAQETGGNAEFPGQRVDMAPGDTIVVQSGPDPVSSNIDIDGLKVEANQNSAQLTLTLGTQLPDGTPENVQSLTLVDYDTVNHLGANVTVIANDNGDTIGTNSGSDTLQGGAGFDTAVYSQPLTLASFSFSGGVWHVGKAGGASDTIAAFEKVNDNAGHHFFLVGGGSALTIQQAVNLASDGDTILVAPGTYTEQVVINGKALDIEGFGGVNGAGGAVLDGSFTETGALNGNLTIQGFTINASGQQNGISLTPTLTGAETVTINDDSITGASHTGFAVNGGGTELTVDTTNSSFSGNGINKGLTGGSGDIDFFEFLGNAAFSNDLVTGTAAGTLLANAGDNGIQIAGFDETTKAVTNAIGHVSFDDVAVTGTYAKNLVYIQGYDNADNLTFTGPGLILGNATTQTGWTSLFVDLGPQGGAYAPSTPSTLDLANVHLDGWSFVPGDAVFAELNALGAQTVIVGAAGTSNVITGTTGNDAIIYNQAEGGSEQVDGGPGTDTEIINGTNAIETFNINPIAGSPNALGIEITGGPDTATALNSSVTTTNVEEIVLNLGNGGDTVNITGDLNSVGVATSTVTVNGGTGNDTVDASGMTDNISGSPVDVVFNGGGGNDLFKGPGTLTATSFTYDSVHNDWVVQTASQGADTLHGVSTVSDSLGDRFLLVSPDSQYTTIQAAVDAAQNGDTILVAPGTYQEQVLINGKDLTLIGEPGAVIDAPNTLHASFTLPAASTGTPNKFALIGIENDASVTIEGFSIDGRGQGNQTIGGDYAGIYFWNSDGHVLD
ncbi:MAG TPA: hypothetical protein VLX44_18260, partial [Xanthobacteraceae bacterium]|nr:hypothetical protein [Xanthobacteraceae bacterium]